MANSGFSFYVLKIASLTYRVLPCELNGFQQPRDVIDNRCRRSPCVAMVLCNNAASHVSVDTENSLVRENYAQDACLSRH